MQMSLISLWWTIDQNVSMHWRTVKKICNGNVGRLMQPLNEYQNMIVIMTRKVMIGYTKEDFGWFLWYRLFIIQSWYKWGTCNIWTQAQYSIKLHRQMIKKEEFMIDLVIFSLVQGDCALLGYSWSDGHDSWQYMPLDPISDKD